MNRSLLAVLAGTITVILFTLLAGIILIDVAIRMWLIPLGFILACLIIGVVGRIRVLHLVLVSLIIYLGLMIFLAVTGTLLAGVQFPPLHLDAIILAWNEFQLFVNAVVPFLVILSDIAAMLRAMTGGTSILAIFLEFFVASLFIGIIGLLITGVSAYFTRDPGLHVVTTPEPTVEVPPPAEPTTTPPLGADLTPALEAVQSAAGQTPSAMPEAPTPPLPEKGGSDSAQAIAGLKGKVDKHLKGTGQKVPAGQSRCPHCNATIIRGSRFCNACEKDF
jgi:hypothetical protein